MPDELSRWPGLSMSAGKHVHRWSLHGPDGAKAEVYFTPRLITSDMLALREAAVAVSGGAVAYPDGERTAGRLPAGTCAR